MRTLCLLIAALYVPLAGAAFKCVDEKGKTHVGDTPPEGCANVAMYEVSKSGTVLRKIDPPLTPAQLEQRKKDAEAKKEADKAAAEQKRKDDALLASFSSEKEFEVVRDRQIAPLRGRIASSQERLKAIEKRHQEIAAEMEFYQAGKGKARSARGEPVHPPHILVAENDRLEAEKQANLKGIASAEREIEVLRARFDADRKRWVTLKTAGASAAAAAGAGEPPKPVRK